MKATCFGLKWLGGPGVGIHRLIKVSCSKLLLTDLSSRRAIGRQTPDTTGRHGSKAIAGLAHSLILPGR
jgi:hypothetical protein